MNPNDLLNNPQLKDISPDKLQMLLQLAQSTSPSSGKPNDMAASLKNASESAKKEGVDFSGAERDLIIEALKQNMPSQEQKKVDLLMQMMKNMRR